LSQKIYGIPKLFRKKKPPSKSLKLTGLLVFTKNLHLNRATLETGCAKNTVFIQPKGKNSNRS
jgi:hypothetical protein